MTTNESDVEFQSVLRIRPLQKKEKDDHVVLEAANNNKSSSKRATATAVLHPLFLNMTSPDTRSRGSFSSPIQNTEESVYHFDKIFDTNSTQDTLHYAIGLSMASHAMEPLKKSHSKQTTKNHLVITTGMTNSGKSYTVFGGTTKRTKQHADDGLIPRILESLFSQSKHHVNSKSSFAIRITILHVEGDKVHDLLSDESAPDSASKSSSSSNNKRSGGSSGVRAMVANFEKGRAHDDDGVAIHQNPNAYKTCWNATEARETLNTGLTRAANQSSSSSRFVGAFGGGGGKSSSSTRGHTMVTIQPVLIQGRRRDSRAVDRCGGTIAVLDMAGLERVKNKGRSKHDSVAANSSHSAVMHVLRTLKHNTDVKEGKEPLAVFRGDNDDSSDGSDISNVSEPKGGAQHAGTLKVVPYRQSQVTMLLQPLFSQTGEWNGSVSLGKTIVTTILAAYPGHRDYTEKQSLLNDMELLFGAEMSRKASHRVQTGMTSAEPAKKKAVSKHEKELGAVEKPTAKALRKSSSPAYMASAPAEDYVGPIDMHDGMPLAPIPPPYKATPVMASAPSDADLDVDPSPSPSVAQDFPGVAIPGKASHKVMATSSAKKHSHYSSQKASPSPGHSNTSTPLMAKVGSSPNIRPPSSSRKTPLKEDKSPNWSRKAESPLKSISRAVNASKKKGQRALEKLVDSASYSRLPVRLDENASKESLIRHVKELEDENEVLSARNEALEERCEKLERERDHLKRSLREATGRLSQSWTEQDEQEWQRSKRLRVQEQRLIGSPLQQHIAHVEATHEISSDWVHGGKPPFALKFPTSWTPARVLNDREHDDQKEK